MGSPVSPNSDAASVGGAAEGLPLDSGDAGSTLDSALSSTLGSTGRTAWRLVRFMAEVDARGLAVTVATALGCSVTEGVALVLLLPLLAVAGMNFGGSSMASRLGADAQRMLAGAGVPPWLWLPVVLGIFLATGAVRSLLRRKQTMLVFATMTRTELELSRRVYESVVKAQWGFLVRQRAGRLTHLLTGELRRVTEAIVALLTLINVGCLTLLYLAVALKLSAPMTLLVAAMGGVLMLLQRGSLERARVSGNELGESIGEVFAATEEHLLNLKSVKTYNNEDRDVRLFGALCEEVARRTAGTARHQTASDSWFEAGSLAALGVAIFLALRVLHVQAATMLLLLAIFMRLMPQLASLQSQVHRMASVLPAFDHVLAIEAECLANAEPVALAGGTGAAAELSLRRELRMEDVWFAYRSSEREPRFVLRGIDLAIEAGTVTAVTGPSGAGKSTIADLSNGLLLPTRGRLLLDGQVLDPAMMREWRSRVGYVGQDTVLFHQGVRENLLWARPEATEDELREALLMAAAGFVYELPGGLESVVGDRGILLSSGQRQRISLARALLRRPALLILDEATNALDVENEARILDAIRDAVRERRGELTVLMIAHRTSAVRRADRIFELEDGRVGRAGAWEELNAGARS
jgi:ATP-binding cassette subfamily C protein